MIKVWVNFKEVMSSLDKSMTLDVLVIVFASLLIALGVLNISICGIIAIPFLSIVLVNFYILSALFIAAIKSDKESGSWTGVCQKKWMNDFLPTRTSGLVIVFLFILLSIISFAGIFRIIDPSLNTLDAIFMSFSMLLTLDAGDKINQGVDFRYYVMWGYATGILLIAAGFGLLLSRISSFKSDNGKGGERN
jgi:hypothetical protein